MQENLPNHVALIPDGNRRWAKERFLPIKAGHREGANRAKEIAQKARDLGIATLTFWGLSTENWQKRTAEEVANLIDLITKSIDEFLETKDKDRIRFVHLGRKDRLPQILLDRIARAEEETKSNTPFVLNLALDYGGRDEIVRAVNNAVSKGEEVTEEMFSKLLDTGDQPYSDPDLIIRTGGEQRVSGLMPWQAHYSEFYFAKEFLPDFTAQKFEEALADYAARQRRYGK